MKPPLNEQSNILRKYLLHELEEMEQEQVELKLLTDAELGRRLVIAQAELIDDFAARRLSDREMNLFQTYYVTTPERVQRLNFGIALDRYVSERLPLSDDRAGFEKPFAFWRRPLTSALAIAGLILIAGAALLIGFRLYGPTQNLQLEVTRINSNEQRDFRPLSVLMLNSSDTRVLTLKHNVVREDGVERLIESNGDISLIRLLLEVPSGSYSTYKASLQTVDAKDLAAITDLDARSEAGAQFVIVNLPAKLIDRGDYRLKLTGVSADGRSSDVGVYSFSVRK